MTEADQYKSSRLWLQNNLSSDRGCTEAQSLSHLLSEHLLPASISPSSVPAVKHISGWPCRKNTVSKRTAWDTKAGQSNTKSSEKRFNSAVKPSFSFKNKQTLQFLLQIPSLLQISLLCSQKVLGCALSLNYLDSILLMLKVFSFTSYLRTKKHKHLRNIKGH